MLIFRMSTKVTNTLDVLCNGENIPLIRIFSMPLKELKLRYEDLGLDLVTLETTSKDYYLQPMWNRSFAIEFFPLSSQLTK